MTGIYCIENKINGKKYIGQAKDIKSRWHTHKTDLIRGTHYNKHLQRAWNMYGPDAFLFYVLEICDVSSLSDREIFYIQKHGSFENGYNMTQGGEGTRGHHHTEEHKKYMSDLFKGRPKSEEAKKRMSKAKKGKPQEETENRKNGRKIVSEKLKGRKFSDEHRMNLSKSLKGREPWNKGKSFPSESSPMYGKHLSESAKKKISEANKGRKRTEAQRLACAKAVVCVETGDIFKSLADAAKAHGVTPTAILHALKHDGAMCQKLHWKYLEGGGES